ncbi:MAG: FAD-dependent oxidoreductase [Gaiellaceae bacterium]
MFADARSVPRDTRLDTDVCIIGAGAAGITLALEFIGSPFQVTVLESGGFQYETETQDLYQGDSVGLPYSDLNAPRLRFFGGTTNHWGGICRPFEDADFEAREGIPFTGWPIKKDDVDPFYGRAVRVVRLPSQDWDLDDWAPGDQLAPLRLRGDRIVSRVTQVVEPNLRSFGDGYRDELSPASNVTVYLHANATGVEADEGGRNATSVRVATLEGNSFSVDAKVFVLATGAVENARLLLVSNERQTRGLGNQTDLVGRFFLEHPRFLGGLIVPSTPPPNLGFYETHRVGGALVRGYLASSKDVQLAEGLMDLQIRLELDYGDAPEDASDFARHVLTLAQDLESWQEIAIPGSPVPLPYLDVIREALDSPEDTYIYLRGRLEAIGLTTRIEQAPNPDSRVLLVGERDELGMQRVALDWRLSDVDKRNVQRTLELLGAEVGRAGIGRLKILYREDDSGWPDDLGGGQHHMGTTRMSDDPKQGVVDRNCRVHGMSNLFVAGSSVFPTPGGATPTLMLVALTIRLGDHLKSTMLQ